jgi:hypothetical protein
MPCILAKNGRLLTRFKEPKEGIHLDLANLDFSRNCIHSTPPLLPDHRVWNLLPSSGEEHRRASVKGVVGSANGAGVQSGGAHNGTIPVLFPYGIQRFVELVHALFLLKKLKLHSAPHQSTQAHTD